MKSLEITNSTAAITALSLALVDYTDKRSIQDGLDEINEEYEAFTNERKGLEELAAYACDFTNKLYVAMNSVHPAFEAVSKAHDLLNEAHDILRFGDSDDMNFRGVLRLALCFDDDDRAASIQYTIGDADDAFHTENGEVVAVYLNPEYDDTSDVDEVIHLLKEAIETRFA